MKHYKLKKWYPSLKQDWSKGDVAEWFDGYYWNKGKVILNGLSKNEVENNPDFWGLIEEEKPLFVTEDGVELFYLYQTVYLIRPKTFIKQKSDLGYFSTNDLDNNKVFFHESNADEYIWKNKRVFSYEDMMKAKHSILITNEDIEISAKERSEQ